MKKITVLFIVLSAGTLLQAQTPAKIVRQAAKAAVAKPAVRAGTLSRYNGINGAVMGVDYYLQRNIAQTQLPAAAQRSWLEQQKRDMKAWQIKHQRHLAQQQIAKRALAEKEYQKALASLPRLQPTQTFKVANFSAHVPTLNQLPKPTVPFAANPGNIAYRGLALAADGSSVANILKNGLRLQDAGEDSNTLRIAYASHGGYDAIKSVLDPVTNLTYGPNSAVSWGAKRLSNDLPILTIVKIRGTFEGTSVEIATEDIPASQIEEVIVRLNIEGKSTWCKVELNEDNTFTLTPYEPNYPPSK